MKKVIITGANEGIGLYMVKQLLKEQNYVTVLDLQIDNLKELEEEYFGKFLAFVCDVRDEKAIYNAVNESVKKNGGVDIAVHNACKCTFESMENSSEDIYKEVFDVNYFGALRLTRAVLPYMKSKNHGKIIYTSSGVGVTGFTNISPYACSKGAIETLARCLNIEYRDFGVSFHIFHPPLTRTKSSSPLPVPKEFMADPSTVGKGLAKNINKKSFVICDTFSTKIQTKMCYLFPIAIGKLMSKLTKKCGD